MSGQRRIVVISGLAGSGLNTARTVLEDNGFEVVDNPPLRLLPQLLAEERGAALALGIDARTRGFNSTTIPDVMASLAARPEVEAKLLFIDCDDDVLLQRFSATRRRHPLAADRSVADGIRAERVLAAGALGCADVVVNTAHLSIHDLRRILDGHFPAEADRGLLVNIVSFSYRHGLPREADLVFDVRFLRNPHWEPQLQPKTGQDPEVAAYIAGDSDFGPFYSHLTSLLETTLPRYKAEGKNYLTLAFGCTGGKHRSVYLAERLKTWLDERGQTATLLHRELTTT